MNEAFQQRPNGGFALTFRNNVQVSVVPTEDKEFAEVCVIKLPGTNITREYNAERTNPDDGIIYKCTSDDIANIIKWAKDQ